MTGARLRAAGPAPPDSADAALIARLGEDLTAARFVNERVAELLGPPVVAALDREQIVPAQLRVLEHLAQPAAHSPDPCAVLAGLWLAAVDVTADQLEAALPRTGRRRAARAGPDPDRRDR